MKKFLKRTASVFLILSLLAGIMLPLASAAKSEEAKPASAQSETQSEKAAEKPAEKSAEKSSEKSAEKKSNEVEPISIEAQSALLIDMDTDQVLYEQAADETRYPASITKIMTALLTLEAIGRGELSLDTVVTAPQEAFEGLTKDSSTANIAPGEKMSVKDLLHCLLLASANEAANILAITVGGDIPSFVDLMNERAQELGMTNTHFANPHGLHNAEHYTTAKDIYKMAKQAMTHAPFRGIVSTGQYTTQATNMAEPRLLANTNALLTDVVYYGYTYRGTIGIKTGHTDEAGYCLVSASKQSGRTLLSVVLGAQNPKNDKGKVQLKQFSESSRLLDWGFTNFSSAKLLDADTYLEEVPLRFSLKSSHVVLQPARSVNILIPGEFDPERAELRLHLEHDTVSAPVEKGKVLGTVDVIYDGQKYDTVDMLAINDIPFSPAVAFISSINSFFGNILVQILLIIAAILIVIGLLKRFRDRIMEAKKRARQKRQEEKKRRAEERRKREEEALLLKQEKERKRQEELARKRQEDLERRRAEEERRHLEQQEKRRREEEKRLQREEEARRRRDEQDRRRRAERERRWHEEQDRMRRAEEERRRREDLERQRRSNYHYPPERPREYPRNPPRDYRDYP